MTMTPANSEKKLLSVLKVYNQHAPHYRCLHISRLDENETGRDAARALIDALRNEQSSLGNLQIFLCRDGDIFITGSGFTRRILDSQIQGLNLGDDLTKATLKHTHLYEIGFQYDEILEIITEKQKQHAAEETRKAAQDAQAKRQAALHRPLSQPLVASIGQRRLDRIDNDILIIEDDLFTRKLLSQTFGELPHYFAGNAADGIEAYVRRAPDLVFLDIGLPDASGLDVMLRLKEIDPHAFIVMLSGNSDTQNVVAAVERGAKGFVAKPFAKSKLLAAIQKSPHIQKRGVKLVPQESL